MKRKMLNDDLFSLSDCCYRGHFCCCGKHSDRPQPPTNERNTENIFRLFRLFSFTSHRTFMFMLFCTFLFSLPSLSASQHNDDVMSDDLIALEPSKTLLPNLMENSDHGNEREVSYNEETAASNRPCLFEARPGRLFNQSLAERIEELHPGALRYGRKIKIQIPDLRFNDWLLYDGDSQHLIGVPLSHHLHIPAHFMLQAVEGGSVVSKNQCVVNVVRAPSYDGELHWESPTEHLGCLPEEAKVVLVLHFDVDSKDLGAKGRARLLQALTRFIRLLNRCEDCKCDVTMDSDDHSVHTAFMSGEGNVDGGPLSDLGVSVYWTIGCATDKLELNILDSVEKLAQNGTMTQLTGYDVIEWRIENWKPHSLHLNPKQRLKRRTGAGRKKSHRRKPSPASENAAFDSNFDVKPQNLQSEEVIKPPVGKIPKYTIRHSPVVDVPTATPVIPDPPVRNIPPQNSPYIDDVNSSPSPFTRNSPPEARMGVDDITVFNSTYFEIKIPRDAFHDPEDGDTRFLSLNIMEITPEIRRLTWLKMDQHQHVMFGVPPGAYRNSKRNSYKFLLIAEDKNRKSTTDDFFVTLDPRPRPMNHRVTFYTKYNLNMDKDSLVSQFSKLLSDALEEGSTTSNPPGRYTIFKVEVAGSRLAVTWFDNSLGSKITCDRTLLGKWSEEMIGRSFGEITDQRVTPTQSFRKKFQPDFVIKSIKFSLSDPCLSKENLTIVEPNGVWPSTTSNVGPPSTIISKIPFFSASTLSTTTTSTSPTTTRTTTTTTSAAPKTFTTSFTTTTTTIRTTTIQKPFIMTLFPTTSTPEPAVFVMESVEGKISVKNAAAIFRRDELQAFTPATSTLKIEAVYGSIPQWLSVNQREWDILALPSAPHLSSLKIVNSTHKLWQGELYAKNKMGGSSDRIPITVFVAIRPSSDDLQSKVTHIFKMKIVNYNVKNFTTMESFRLAKIIQKSYGDKNMDKIYIYPVESGSVVFTWHNESLARDGFCPYREIAQLGAVLFDGSDDAKVEDNFRFRLQNAGFNVTTFELLRKNSCFRSPSIEEDDTVTTTTMSSPTTSEVGPVNDLQSGGAGIIILVAVIICLFILAIIIVVKWRSHMKNPRKKDRSDEPLSAAPPGVQNGDTNRAANSSLDRIRNYKAVTPVVLKGEEGESGSLLNKEQTSSARERLTYETNNRDDDQLLRPSDEMSANDDDVRPPPPPYIGKQSAT